jgi:hypothetical protein
MLVEYNMYTECSDCTIATTHNHAVGIGYITDKLVTVVLTCSSLRVAVLLTLLLPLLLLLVESVVSQTSIVHSICALSSALLTPCPTLAVIL